MAYRRPGQKGFARGIEGGHLALPIVAPLIAKNRYLLLENCLEMMLHNYRIAADLLKAKQVFVVRIIY